MARFFGGSAPLVEKPMAQRTATVERNTLETQITVTVNLDGSGQTQFDTGVPFLEHMLDQIARHGMLDLEVKAVGDLHIDDHHTVEDVGIALGQALAKALGDKKGIRRYGACHLAMDDALVRTALDLSGRPFLVWNLPVPTQKIGTFDTELVREFFNAFAMQGGITLHIECLDGINSHHIAEAAFKSVARALRDALEIDPRKADAVPSTKGTLHQ
jgi:imidazoleglycerol-phosphate dehydratase